MRALNFRDKTGPAHLQAGAGIIKIWYWQFSISPGGVEGDGHHLFVPLHGVDRKLAGGGGGPHQGGVVHGSENQHYRQNHAYARKGASVSFGKAFQVQQAHHSFWYIL